jgi:hypothetical protein
VVEEDMVSKGEMIGVAVRAPYWGEGEAIELRGWPMAIR